MFAVFFEGDGTFEVDRYISTWRTEAEAEAAAGEAAAMYPEGEYYVMELLGQKVEPDVLNSDQINWEECPF